MSSWSVLFLAAGGLLSAATWTPLQNRPPAGIGLMVQMTDGTVLAQVGFDGQTWVKLTPDAFGNYANGTWTAIATPLIPREAFGSQVLPDGRFWVVGGEYSGPGLLSNDGYSAEIYDPVANIWTPAARFPDEGVSNCFVLTQVTGNLTTGSKVVTSVYPFTTGLTVGWAVSGTGIPSGATIASIDSTTQITLSAAATATATASTVNLNNSYYPGGCLGDASTMLLPGPKILVGSLYSNQMWLYDVTGNSWIRTANKLFGDTNSEEGWAKLADGSVLNYSLQASLGGPGSFAQRYIPSTGQWVDASGGNLPQLSSYSLSAEIGPILRLLDGRALQLGANQHTGIYNPTTNTWAAGPDIMGTLNGLPAAFGADDAPAALLPNGHVIFAADSSPSLFTTTGDITNGSNKITNIASIGVLQPGWAAKGNGINAVVNTIDSATQVTTFQNATATARQVSITFGGIFNLPTVLFDFNPATNTISPLSTPLPDDGALGYHGALDTRMLMLPTGQLIFSDNFSASSSQAYLYTPDSGASPIYRPVINRIAYNGGGTFTLTGKQLNGHSAGASFGDDYQMDSNYPIVRLLATDGSGKVFYARTSNWSSYGVGLSSTPETVNFTLNPGLTQPGNYAVIVSGAGLSSSTVFLNITQAEINKQ